tara:strand:+ start:408 stop:554 length:147 start_codon:yes stop_codon:yes gene_type:complete
MKLKEYLKKNMSEEDLELYRKIQRYELLKYIAKKEKLDFKELCKKYLN